jgi:hypothetical protein
MGNGGTELLKKVLEALDKDQWSQVITLLLVVNAPWIIATGSAWWLRWKIGKLYEARCADKDGEIDRLAKRVKDLENHLLKKKR